MLSRKIGTNSLKRGPTSIWRKYAGKTRPCRWPNVAQPKCHRGYDSRGRRPRGRDQGLVARLGLAPDDLVGCAADLSRISRGPGDTRQARVDGWNAHVASCGRYYLVHNAQDRVTPTVFPNAVSWFADVEARSGVNDGGQRGRAGRATGCGGPPGPAVGPGVLSRRLRAAGAEGLASLRASLCRALRAFLQRPEPATLWPRWPGPGWHRHSHCGRW